MNKLNRNLLAIMQKVVMIALCIMGSVLFTLSSCNLELKHDGKPDEPPKDAKIVTRSGDLAWDFPVKPGTEEWYLLETEDERVAALQVPEEILVSLSSDDIVRLSIEFPTFIFFTTSDTPQAGFLLTLKWFNLYKQLLSKKGAGEKLLAAYKDADLSGFKTLPYSNKLWVLRLDYLELLLVQKEILQSLTPDECMELLLEARKKTSEKINHEDFSLYGSQSSLRIMATILDAEGVSIPKGEIVTRLIETGVMGDISLIDEITRATDNYFNAKK